MTWTRVEGRDVVAMFGATFLVPVLTGFPPATTLLFSGMGTILFLVITGNRLPSYLGSSFSVSLNLAPAAKANFDQGPLVGAVTLVLLACSVARRSCWVPLPRW